MSKRRQPIPKTDLDKVKGAYETNRAMYTHLTNAGYSNRQIGDAFQVNHRTVWERTHDRVYSPREKLKKLRL